MTGAPEGTYGGNRGSNSGARADGSSVSRSCRPASHPLPAVPGLAWLVMPLVSQEAAAQDQDDWGQGHHRSRLSAVDSLWAETDIPVAP